MRSFNVRRLSVNPVEGGLWTWMALVDEGSRRVRIAPVEDLDSREDAECDAFNSMIANMMRGEPEPLEYDTTTNWPYAPSTAIGGNYA